MGDNSVINKAQKAKTETKKADVKEIIQLALASAKTNKYADGDNNIPENMQKELENKYGEGNVSVENNDEDEGGYIVEIQGEGTFLVDDKGNVKRLGPALTYSEVKVVRNSDGSGDSIREAEITDNIKLYINFEVSVEDGTINSITPNVPFEVSKNGTYEFKISYTVNGKEYTRKKKVKINQYDVTPKIGSYVKYNVTYKDMASDYEYTADNGWRILDTGEITQNADGTYTGTGTKLISTGMPAELNYYYSTNYPWNGNAEQVESYTNQFWATGGTERQEMRVCSGLFYNFNKIVFNEVGKNASGSGCQIKNINGKTGNVTGDIFLISGAKEVHNITLAELNKARNNSNIKDSTGVSEDLFALVKLKKYGYSSSGNDIYWFASPMRWGSYNYSSLWRCRTSGYIDYELSGTNGLRPVVTLPDNSELIVTGN